jgi:hypothetical protein
MDPIGARLNRVGLTCGTLLQEYSRLTKVEPE